MKTLRVIAGALACTLLLASCSQQDIGNKSSENGDTEPVSSQSTSVSSSKADGASEKTKSEKTKSEKTKSQTDDTEDTESTPPPAEYTKTKLPSNIENDGSHYSRSLTAMDTVISVTLYGGGEAALDFVEDEITRMEKLFSVTRGNSDIGRLNSSDGKPVTISPETEALLRRSLELNKQTDGTFDITLYPVLQKWGFTTGEYYVPTQDELKTLTALTGSDKLTISNGSASLASGSMVDLGGIAKGYIGDSICTDLKGCGLESGLISIGGAVWTIGTKPDGSAWKVGVADPDEPSDYVGILSVNDEAVATSGGYERFFERDGKTYCHILDPETGVPVDTATTGLISATIVGSDGTLCDALSTALFVMGRDKATEYIEAHSDINAILITTDKTFIVTSSLNDRFKTAGNLRGAAVEVIG